MAHSTGSVVSALLLAIAVVLFAPVFADASAGFEYGSWAYGPYVATVFQYVPVILAAGGLLLIVHVMRRA